MRCYIEGGPMKFILIKMDLEKSNDGDRDGLERLTNLLKFSKLSRLKRKLIKNLIIA